MTRTQDKINKTMEFIHLLLKMKIPYRWWDFDKDRKEDPMYAVETFSEVNLKKIKKDGVNCAGFINLVRLYNGLSVPGVKEKHKYAGGTRWWFNYLKKNNWLEPFIFTKKYPVGTLLIRDYKGLNDQGHVAIIYTDDAEYPWENLIVHSNPEEPYPKVFPKEPVKYGISTKMLATSHYSHEYPYYTHAVLPEFWLIKE